MMSRQPSPRTNRIASWLEPCLLGVLLTISMASLATTRVVAADLPKAFQPELARGLAAVGSKTSDQPALRLERQTHEPSSAFLLGTALMAWSNALEALRYDLKNPSGDGDDSAAIRVDCDDEGTAFAELETYRRQLGLDDLGPLMKDQGLQKWIAEDWVVRRATPPTPCR